MRPRRLAGQPADLHTAHVHGDTRSITDEDTRERTSVAWCMEWHCAALSPLWLRWGHSGLHLIRMTTPTTTQAAAAACQPISTCKCRVMPCASEADWAAQETEPRLGRRRRHGLPGLLRLGQRKPHMIEVSSICIFHMFAYYQCCSCGRKTETKTCSSWSKLLQMQLYQPSFYQAYTSFSMVSSCVTMVRNAGCNFNASQIIS